MQDDLERRVAALQAQYAAMRRDIKAAFRRIDEQTRLTDTVHQLALSIRDLANKQENTQQAVASIRRDVDELKSRPARRWEAVMMEIIKYLALAAAGYLTAHLI
ncbi:MAG: hypothetical protein IJD39_01720 [Clostridia bacterium]|nr:hypothetical protein [Clostridia bacterium]